MNERPLVIYHGNCADGFSAAWCFWRKYGNRADYVAGVYQTEPPDVEDREVYLVDFSYKRDTIVSMLKNAVSVTLIDHHKTAIEDLADVEGLARYTDLERSGATLAWDFLFPGERRPLLLGHVEDRDLWRFRLPGTREIQSFVFSHEYTFEAWDRLMNADQAELLKMTAAGAAIERKHHKDVAELVKLCKRRLTIGGHNVPVASLPYTLSSDAGHLMAKGEVFAACYWDTVDGRVFSLRSTDDGLDVSEVAKQYGGGGHPHAAGFKVPHTHPLAAGVPAIASAQDVARAPEGWKLVPSMLTTDMRSAMARAAREYMARTGGNSPDAMFEAAIAAAPAAPAVAPAPSDELASMTRMFHAACADLGAINEALGLDPDDGGAEPILGAIEELKTRALPASMHESTKVTGPDIVLTGAQLLEALDFIAPDRDADQLESEVAFGYGEGHSGKAMYVWCAEYPEEGSFVCDGSSATAAPAQSEQPDPIIAAKDVLLAAINAGGPKAHFAAGEAFGLADLARKLGMHPHGSMLEAMKAGRQSEPSAYLVRGIDSHNEDYASVWIKRQNADAAAAAIFKASITPLVEQQGDGGVTACPQCGGSLSTWKCMCDPIWSGYAAEQPSARVALSAEQRTALYKQTSDSIATVVAKMTYDEWCAEFVKRLLAASAAQEGKNAE